MKPIFSLRTCGSCRHLECLCIEGGRVKSVLFPAHFGIIEHPLKGLILFDTGYSAHIADATQKWPYRAYPLLFPYTLAENEAVPEQLKTWGYKPSDVKFVIISHFHPDHIGGLRDFTDAQIICSRLAWEGLHERRNWNALKVGFLPGLLSANMADRLIFVEDLTETVCDHLLPGFPLAFDVFGCGSLLAVPLPGHAVGQYGLFLPETQGAKSVFLIADACWRSKSFRENRLPSRLAMRVMDDAAVYASILLKIHQLHSRRNDLLIVPSHCDEITATAFGAAA